MASATRYRTRLARAGAGQPTRLAGRRRPADPTGRIGGRPMSLGQRPRNRRTYRFHPVMDDLGWVSRGSWPPLPIRCTALTIHYDDFPAVAVRRLAPNRANFGSNEWEAFSPLAAVADREIGPGCGRSRAGVAAARGLVCDGSGLPVTPSDYGMRARWEAWRRGLDLRVASCCLEHVGQYSGFVVLTGAPGQPAVVFLRFECRRPRWASRK